MKPPLRRPPWPTQAPDQQGPQSTSNEGRRIIITGDAAVAIMMQVPIKHEDRILFLRSPACLGRKLEQKIMFRASIQANYNA